MLKAYPLREKFCRRRAMMSFRRTFAEVLPFFRLEFTGFCDNIFCRYLLYCKCLSNHEEKDMDKDTGETTKQPQGKSWTKLWIINGME